MTRLPFIMRYEIFRRIDGDVYERELDSNDGDIIETVKYFINRWLEDWDPDVYEDEIDLQVPVPQRGGYIDGNIDDVEKWVKEHANTSR